MSFTRGKRKQQQKYTRVGESQGDGRQSPGLQGCPPHSAKRALATSATAPVTAAPSAVITESQNGRGWKGRLWITWSNPQCSGPLHPTHTQPPWEHVVHLPPLR